MSLKDNFNLSRDGEFQAKLIAALAKKANQELNGLLKTDPKYEMYIRISKVMLSANPREAVFLAQSAAAHPQVDPDSDTWIQSFIDNNFEAIAKMFDPDVPGTD